MNTVESRKAQRLRTLKAGLISFKNGGGISCTIRNMSSFGACLEVINQFGIPEDVMLVIASERFKRPCHIIWQRHNRLGVIFKQTASAHVVSAAKAS